MSPSIELVCVDPSQVHEIWPHVEPLLRRAIARTGLSAFRDIECDVLRGSALLWLAVVRDARGYLIEAAAATTLQQTDAGKFCIITACSGSQMMNWLPLISGIETYASNEGCKAVRIFGRKGWLRLLDGYEAKHIVLEKHLN